MTRSREISHLSKISISIFLHHFLKTSKCFILMQTPLQLDIWLQSYDGFDNAKNNMKQRNLNTGFANISKTTSPTSDSFHLFMSHIALQVTLHEQLAESHSNKLRWPLHGMREILGSSPGWGASANIFVHFSPVLVPSPYP